VEGVVILRDKCSCKNYREFNGEVAIHFPGIKGLPKPIVLTFPKVRVCLDCGYADFTVPERELSVLVTGVPVNGAIASTRREEIA
jgi:hypothetical protein